MKKTFLIILISTISVFLNAETYYLTLDKSIEIAKQKSFGIRNLKEDVKIAEYNLKSATSSIKTHVDLNLVTPNYEQTVKQLNDGTGLRPVDVLNYGSTLTIRQPLITNGSIYVEGGLSGKEDYDPEQKYNRLSWLEGRIGYSQPIDALYGYNRIKSELKLAKLAYERTSKALKQEELNLEYEVSRYYYGLLQAQKSTEISLLDLERQTEANTIAQNKFTAGLIREVEALQTEVDLADAQNTYEMSLVNFKSQILDFNQFIGLDLNDSIVLSDKLEYSVIIIDSDKAVELALANRYEIRDNEISIEQQKLSVKQQKSQGLPRGNLNASIEKIGTSSEKFGDIDIPGSIKNSYNSFMDSRKPKLNVGLTVRVPIIDWGENRALVRAAETRLKKNILTQENNIISIEKEIRNLVAELNNNLKRLQLLEKNVNIAERSFDITRQRFSDGDIDSQSLALERNRLNNAYRGHLSAYIAYQLNLSDIMRKTLYDFRTDNPVK